MSASAPTLTRPSLPAAGTWVIDPAHSTVEAVARHLMVSRVRARFTSFEGTAVIGEDVATSTLDVTIDAASIDTGVADRDTHLRSADFLDVEQHPTLRFTADRVEADGGTWRVPGELTLRGVTRPVTLDLEFLGVSTDPWGNTKAAFAASATIDREAFGITWNQALEAGGVLVSKTLTVALEIQLARQA